MRSVLAKAGAVLALVLLVLLAWHYPANKVWLGALLAGYIGLLLYRPAWWLLAVPALLPVLDFAPWTGWYFLEELDLLLLATCVAGYARLGRERPPTKLPPLAKVTLLLLTLCVLIAAWRGVTPLAPLDANAFSNYVSHYNGLRVLKGFLWPLLLLPLLRATAGTDGVNLRHYLVPGMLLGLAAASLAVIWERSAFPGLFNFASDYRPTAPFSAMHTGGAALDAYLAMSFPFVALWLIGKQTHAHLALGLAALLLGVFAGLTTFSRDIYLAYAASGAVIAVLASANHVRGGTLKLRTMLSTLLLLALLFYVLTQVFASSGYRGLIAALGLLAGGMVLAGAAPKLQQRALAVGLALALLAAALALPHLMPGAMTATGKGAYASYGLAAVVGGAGGLLLLRGPFAQRPLGLALAVAAFPALAASTLLVAQHYAGADALPAAALVVAVATLLAATRLLPVPPWRLDRGTMTLGFFSVIVFAILIPIGGSYYTGSRFATVGSDMGVRLAHWSEALEMMDGDVLTQSFGQGLGRYPDTYLWKNTHGEMPGTFSYQEEGNNRFLRLGAPQYARGYGEVLRILQHVNLQPGQRYLLSFDLRRTDGKAMPHAMVCQRWLIYPQDCSVPRFAPQAWQAGWVHMAAELPLRRSGGGLFGPPLQLELANEAASALDLDNISLQEIDSGRELLDNGSFSAANDYWFFSSDRNHMPWHVKNFAVNTVFELGWVGALVGAFFMLAVGAPLVARGLEGDVQAAVFLAAMTGCMMVGLFDSITDVPRLTILLLLLALAGNLRPQAPRKRRLRSAQPEAAA